MTALRKELQELTEILPEEKIFLVLQFIKEKIFTEKKISIRNFIKVRGQKFNLGRKNRVGKVSE